MKKEFTFTITDIEVPRTPGSSYIITATCVESEVVVSVAIPAKFMVDNEYIKDALTKAHEPRLHINPEYMIKIGDII